MLPVGKCHYWGGGRYDPQRTTFSHLGSPFQGIPESENETGSSRLRTYDSIQAPDPKPAILSLTSYHLY